MPRDAALMSAAMREAERCFEAAAGWKRAPRARAQRALSRQKISAAQERRSTDCRMVAAAASRYVHAVPVDGAEPPASSTEASAADTAAPRTMMRRCPCLRRALLFQPHVAARRLMLTAVMMRNRGWRQSATLRRWRYARSSSLPSGKQPRHRKHRYRQRMMADKPFPGAEAPLCRRSADITSPVSRCASSRTLASQAGAQPRRCTSAKRHVLRLCRRRAMPRTLKRFDAYGSEIAA